MPARKSEEQYNHELSSGISDNANSIYNNVICSLLQENGFSQLEIESLTLRDALIALTVHAMLGANPNLDIAEAVKYGVHYDPGCTDNWTENGCEAWSKLELANAEAIYEMVRGRESRATKAQKKMAHFNYSIISDEVGYVTHPQAITTKQIREAFYLQIK